jgi:hypothetical protein
MDNIVIVSTCNVDYDYGYTTRKGAKDAEERHICMDYCT